jgi:tetratricopeptide (TPR) repeat protein
VLCGRHGLLVRPSSGARRPAPPGRHGQARVGHGPQPTCSTTKPTSPRCRSVLVQLGKVRPASDILERHIIHLDNDVGCRNALATRLETAGCLVKKIGTSWLKKGNFSLEGLSPPDALFVSPSENWERIRLIVEEVLVEKAVPLFERLQKAIDDIAVHGVKVIEKIEQLDQANRKALLPESENQEDIRRRLQSGEGESVFDETEKISKRDDKAERYKNIAGLCVKIDDKYYAFRAAHRYLELSGESATAYQFVGYIYWWFKDIETAIVHTERAVQIAQGMRNGVQKAETMRNIENNLAFYYAEKGINKVKALSLAERSLKDLTEDNKYYVHLMDTAGYVYLKFGTTAEEMDIAINYFKLAFEMEPKTQGALNHLQEALIKKKELQK